MSDYQAINVKLQLPNTMSIGCFYLQPKPGFRQITRTILQVCKSDVGLVPFPLRGGDFFFHFFKNEVPIQKIGPGQQLRFILG